MQRHHVLVLAIMALAARAAAADAPVEVALLHGRIHTQDPHRTVVEALAVRGNTIVALGSDREITALIGPDTRNIDLRGRTVLPGIIDAHTHPAASAQDVDKCSLHDDMLGSAEIKVRAVT